MGSFQDGPQHTEAGAGVSPAWLGHLDPPAGCSHSAQTPHSHLGLLESCVQTWVVQCMHTSMVVTPGFHHMQTQRWLKNIPHLPTACRCHLCPCGSAVTSPQLQPPFSALGRTCDGPVGAASYPPSPFHYPQARGLTLLLLVQEKRFKKKDVLQHLLCFSHP